MFFNPPKKDKITPQVEEKKIEIPDAKEFPKNWVSSTTNQLITSYLYSDTEVATLAGTCRFLYHYTKPHLATRLAHHIIIEPNEEKVIDMLKRQPTLIMSDVVIKSITDNSGRILSNNTLFQLAFGAGDESMCLAMKQAFITVYGSEEAAIQKMKEQHFQKFSEDKEEEKRKADSLIDLRKLLTSVTAAIHAEQFNLGNDVDGRLILSDATLTAIETFRKGFSESQPKHITRGMHFCNNTFLEILSVYNPIARRINFDYDKCALFEDGILSSVLFYVPANYAQKFIQGLFDLYNGEELVRSLALKDIFYLTCHEQSIDLALTGLCIDIVSGVKHVGERQKDIPGDGMILISKFIKDQRDKLIELMNPVKPSSKSRCVIC